MSINLSAHQLADPQLAWTIQAALAHASASPSWVTLELTESMLMDNRSASLERLHAIRALGVQIAIDDLGTGYSSLAYLEQFPITHIKIDRSFVTPLDDPKRGAGVVHAIIKIGSGLGLTTVAEGNRDADPAPAAARAGVSARSGLPLREAPRARRDGRPRGADGRPSVRDGDVPRGRAGGAQDKGPVHAGPGLSRRPLLTQRSLISGVVAGSPR